MKVKTNGFLQAVRGGFKSFVPLWFAISILLVTSPAWAVGGLDGLQSKLQSFNTTLIAIGGALTITGFVWAIAALILGMAGAARAITVLLGGLAIGLAPQIVGFFTSGM